MTTREIKKRALKWRKSTSNLRRALDNYFALLFITHFLQACVNKSGVVNSAPHVWMVLAFACRSRFTIYFLFILFPASTPATERVERRFRTWSGCSLGSLFLPSNACRICRGAWAAGACKVKDKMGATTLVPATTCDGRAREEEEEKQKKD